MGEDCLGEGCRCDGITLEECIKDLCDLMAGEKPGVSVGFLLLPLIILEKVTLLLLRLAIARCVDALLNQESTGGDQVILRWSEGEPRQRRKRFDMWWWVDLSLTQEFRDAIL